MKRLLIIVVIVTVLGITAFFILNTFQKTSTQKVNPLLPTTSATNLYTLVTNKESKKCTWEKTDKGVKNIGTIVTSEGKFSMEFQSILDENGMITHMMGDGKTIYVWWPSTNEGSTLTYADIQNPTDIMKDGMFYESMDYTCEDWKPEATKFTLPKNISFN